MRSTAISHPLRSRWSAIGTATLVLVLGAAAHHASAQAPAASGPGQTTAPAGQSDYRAIRANEMIGMPVVSPQGQALGQVRDLVVNLNTGDVRYAILAFERGVFTDDVLFAVPTQQLRARPDGDALVYRNMERERLAQAAIRHTDLDRGAVAYRDMWGRIDRAWGIQQPTGTARAMLASELLDSDVRNAAGETIGEIETLVINLANSRVHYAVMEYDPGWLSPERKVALPLAALRQAGQEPDELMLNITRERAAALPELDRNWYGNLNDPRHVADVDRHLLTNLPAFTLASAGTGTLGGPGADLFKRLDSSGNGWLNREEIAAVPELERHWNAIDRDRDGRIGRDEFARLGVSVQQRR